MSKLLQSTKCSIIQQCRSLWTRKTERTFVKRGQTLFLRIDRVVFSTAISKITPVPAFLRSKKLANSSANRNNCFNYGCTHSYSAFHKYQSIMNVPEGIFRGNLDRFNGITVESSAEFSKDVDFAEKLKKSVEFWSTNNRRAIWFKVNTEHSEWIPHLCEQQFDFHHAKSGFVVMFRWLPTDEYVNIPAFAHTLVGVGGIVINKKNEVLVVSDRYALIPDSWKLPGGYVEARENLVDAAIREVREETGIDCEFKTVVCIRHSHRGGFNCSDMYVVVALTPLRGELKRCEREIAKIQWMPIGEYLQHPNVHETNRHFMRTLLDYNKRGICFTCEKAKHQVLQIDYNLYYMQKQEQVDEGRRGSTELPCNEK